MARTASHLDDQRAASPRSPGEGRRHRSRLTPAREAELYAVTLSLLADAGYEALTMDAVAHAAHTSKATIYRQWQGKAGLVVAALRHVKDPAEALPDTGSLRGDLLEVARSLGDVAVEQSRLLAAASHAMQVDAELAAAVRDLLVAPAVDRLGALLDRAVERGEVAPTHPAARWVPELLLDAFLARPLMGGHPADGRHLTALVDDIVLPALAAAPTSTGAAPGHHPPRSPARAPRPRPHGGHRP